MTAWLKEEDNVIKTSGKPSWSSLMKSLEEHGHNGIIAKIKEHLQCVSGQSVLGYYTLLVGDNCDLFVILRIKWCIWPRG